MAAPTVVQFPCEPSERIASGSKSAGSPDPTSVMVVRPFADASSSRVSKAKSGPSTSSAAAVVITFMLLAGMKRPSALLATSNCSAWQSSTAKPSAEESNLARITAWRMSPAR